MDENRQLELFLKDEASPSPKSLRPGPLRLQIRKSERLILLIFAFAVCSIISFVLGVEKGKNTNLAARRPVSLDMAKTQAPAIVLPPVVKTPEIKEGYTIQLASYKSLNSAQKEAESLKRKGITPLILNKTGYIVLCAGRFIDKETAQSLLSELKSRYADCYIRRL